MPKLLFARPPLDPKEERQVRQLAASTPCGGGIGAAVPA